MIRNEMYFIKLISFVYVLCIIIIDDGICQTKSSVIIPYNMAAAVFTNSDGTDITAELLTTDDDIDDDLITDDNDLVDDVTTEAEVTTVETTLKTTTKLTTKQPTTIKPVLIKATKIPSTQPITVIPKNDLNNINNNQFFSCIESDCQYDYSPVCTVTANNIKVTLINFCMIHISNCLANKTIYTFVQNGTCPRVE